MPQDPRSYVGNLFTQVDISPGSQPAAPEVAGRFAEEQTLILKQVLQALDRQNELLEELVSQSTASQRQRHHELEQWKDANPVLARKCKEAADLLGKIQADFLERISDEVRNNGEDFIEGEFLLNEFVDRFGPRLAHLNGVLQVLSQLGAAVGAKKS